VIAERVQSVVKAAKRTAYQIPTMIVGASYTRKDARTAFLVLPKVLPKSIEVQVIKIGRANGNAA
jgi:hypothetical protein